MVIPGVLDSRTSTRKVFFFGSQDHQRRPADGDRHRQLPDRARAPRRLLADEATTAGANYGTISRSWTTRRAAHFWQHLFRRSASTPSARRCSTCCYSRTATCRPAPTSNTTPTSSATRPPSTTASTTSSAATSRQREMAVQRPGPRRPGEQHQGQRIRARHRQGEQHGARVGQLSGMVTTVLSPTLVNEMNIGFAINHYNQRGYPNDYDYQQGMRTSGCLSAASRHPAPTTATTSRHRTPRAPARSTASSSTSIGVSRSSPPPAATVHGAGRLQPDGHQRPRRAHLQSRPALRLRERSDEDARAPHPEVRRVLENDETHAPVSGVQYG